MMLVCLTVWFSMVPAPPVTDCCVWLAIFLQTQDFSSSDISTFRNLIFLRNTGFPNIRYIFFPKPCWLNVVSGSQDFLQSPSLELFITKNEESQRLWNFKKKCPPKKWNGNGNLPSLWASKTKHIENCEAFHIPSSQAKLLFSTCRMKIKK